MNKAIVQAANKPCPECGGQRVIAMTHIKTGMSVMTGIFSSTRIIPVSCTCCGLTTFYAEEPSKVRSDPTRTRQ
jgi:hypothetical protein